MREGQMREDLHASGDAVKSISRTEFWLGVATIVAAVFGTVLGTWGQLRATREQVRANGMEADRKSAAEATQNLTTAVNGVKQALQGHGSMYIEMRECLSAKIAAPDCWMRPYKFDADASQAAWNDFDVRLAHADIFLRSTGEREQLQLLRTIKSNHMREVWKVRAPETPEEADKVIGRMEMTQIELTEALTSLASAVSTRLQAGDDVSS